MRASTYYPLRKQLFTEGAFQVSNLYGAMTVICEFAVLGLGLACLYHTELFSAPYWALQVILSTSLFRMFVILHECGHNTLFTRKIVNTLVGSAVSSFCLLPYVAWRDIHFLHHKWVGVVDKDPTQAHLLVLRRMSGVEALLFRIIWRLWIPIPFIQFVFKVFWLYPFREFLNGNRPTARKGFLSLAVCLTPHLFFISYFGIRRYLFSFGPMILLFYMIYEVINLPQHSGLFPYISVNHPHPLSYKEQDEFTRTTRLPRVLAVCLNYNFNLHVEHHLFPSVPWYALPRVTEKLAAISHFEYQRVPFLKFMVAMRRNDPLNVYVKSLPPVEVENG